MTTPLSADVVVKSLKQVLSTKFKNKKASIVFQADTGHQFKIGDIKVGDEGLVLVEAERYSAPIGFH